VSKAEASWASLVSAIHGNAFLQCAQVGVPLLDAGTRFLVLHAGQTVIRESFTEVAMT
jgi:hypothetical protein